MKINNFRNSAHVDLLADIDLKNNLLVEFSDLKDKSSSNFKSFELKLRDFRNPAQVVDFWPMLTSKIIAG